MNDEKLWKQRRGRTKLKTEWIVLSSFSCFSVFRSIYRSFSCVFKVSATRWNVDGCSNSLAFSSSERERQPTTADVQIVSCFGKKELSLILCFFSSSVSGSIFSPFAIGSTSLLAVKNRIHYFCGLLFCCCFGYFSSLLVGVFFYDDGDLFSVLFAIRWWAIEKRSRIKRRMNFILQLSSDWREFPCVVEK